jgi:segregation and condensation protein B
MENTEVQLDPETDLLPGVATSNIELPFEQLRAVVEAVIYVTDEPLSADQIATALQQPAARIGQVLEELTAEYGKPEHGLTIREVAGGYKISTKPEHHEAIRAFVKNLKPPLKLSLAALETLALIAYKQPITAPEVMEVRGVQGAGVIKTLIDRKLIATAGRKTVLGKPILYKTTKEFLVQFGLKDLSELPTLKEFEELGRLSMGDDETALEVPEAEPPSEPTPVEGSRRIVRDRVDAARTFAEVARSRWCSQPPPR